jgi:hypothetical protein
MFSPVVLKIALVLALILARSSADDALQRAGWSLRVWLHLRLVIGFGEGRRYVAREL